MTKKKIDDTFFHLFCEKNSDNSRYLRLKGNELIHRIGRRLKEDDMHELCKFLRNNPKVKYLNLAYNDLTDDGLQILAEEYFAFDNNLEFLNLIQCDIGAAGMKSLSSAEHLNLKSIRLLGNKLGSEGAPYLGALIKNCPNLEGLDIGQTDQVLESIESLLIVIERSKLKFLNISRVIPTSFYSKYNSSFLADDVNILLKLNNTLEELRVQKCGFDGHDIELIIDGLTSHPNLTMLDLTANRMGDHGIRLFANWLRTRPKLIALRVPGNDIGNTGAQALGYYIPFSRLRLLDIQNNRIGDQGISYLLDSLNKTTPMRMLFMWGNKFEQGALKKIERALKVGFLEQEFIDVKVCHDNGNSYAAYYPANNYQSKVFCTLQYGVPPELKIIRHKVSHKNDLPRRLIDLEFIERYPPVNESLGLKIQCDKS